MRWGILFASGLLIAGAVTSTVGRTADGATRRTPTPSATPTATVTLGAAPAPPDFWNIRQTAGSLQWNDRSDNEDGFDVELVACASDPSREARFDYRVPANTTRLTFPQEYAAALSRCPCGSQQWTVTAFNAFGRAPTTLGVGGAACAPSATATPAVVTMPRTGAGDGGDGAGITWWLAGIGAALFVGTTVFLYVERRARGRAT
jgi:hypothetical protein